MRLPISLLAVLLLGFTLSLRAEDAPPPRLLVSDVPDSLRDSLKLDPFYQKHANADGLPILVMAPTEMTTDVPEQRNMTPKDYWDKRARGLGGRLTSCGEENLLNLKGDRYARENILVHEFSHAVHHFGIGSLD